MAEWEKLYSLEFSSGYALAGDQDESKLLPVWPHERFAQLCVEGDWQDYKVVEISLSEWFDHLSKKLITEGIKVAVFPLREGRGVRVTPERLSADIHEELLQYEE